MTDRERLEEIKSRVWKDKGIYAMGDYSQREGYIYTLSDYDYEWLVKQTERVEELAKERAEWEIEARTQYAINKRLKKEIKQYRQALREIKNTDTTKEVYRLWAEQALKGEYKN